MAKISFSDPGVSVEAEAGEWMYEVCERVDSGIPFACKAGACGTCATEVVEGIDNIAKLSAREARTLEEHGLDTATYRLPCLKDVGGDLVWGRPANAADRDADIGTHDVVVESYRPLTLSVCEVRFFVDSPSFSFRPGQYVIFQIPDTPRVVRRSYSISTPPSDERHFEVCVRAVSGGFGSNYIHRLRSGDRLKIEGPHGDFVLNEKSDRDILMIATGTGIAPIKSMLMHLLDQRSGRRIRLFFGLRHESDLFYTDVLRGLAAHYPSFESHVILSRPARAGTRAGRVTDLIDELVFEADAGKTEVYLCGSAAMIEDSCERLRQLGFDDDALHFERFY